MKELKAWSLKFLGCLMVFSALMMSEGRVSAQDYEDEFNLNDLVVQGELYIWNRISDLLDIVRGGVAGGPGIGAEVSLTEYVALGAYTNYERGVDFPHCLPPLWFFDYFEKRPILNFHEGRYSTAVFGPWRKETFGVKPSNYFPRHKWDIRVQADLALLHAYVNVSMPEALDFIGGFVGWDPNLDDQRLDASQRRLPADQFGRGISNFVFGVWEVPSNIIRVGKAEGDLAGLTKGTGIGVYRFICRELVGAAEIVTFPFGWTPIIEPVYVFQSDSTSLWSIKRPSFHRIY